ncbi:Tudor/PWWP/MBT superfamily protein [Euphorbia peplus]|nr:Tudor/PWWP/MBT superfamily protein [Euphorbia peplus]
MGSSGSGAFDCSVGPIVWVRRRNGSWWPGKILGPDELAECNLTSPRTGTPVKLLGREDASVDWYNLEKSKRVKAFRCGEFDDSIERAESSHSIPIKKREKYARREDAILHALELEKQLLKKQGKFSSTSDHPRSKTSGSAKEPSFSSDGLASNSGKSGIANLNRHLNRVDSVVKVEIVGSAIDGNEENQSTSEDDHSEGMPRMRGLQDFGLKTAPLKRKLQSPVDSDGSKKPMLDHDIQAHSVGTPSMERSNDSNGVDQLRAFCRAKRSRCIYLPSESNDSLDDKELPANQKKMFHSELEDDDGHTHHHGSLNEQNSSSGFMEDVESDSSATESSDSESDSSETEPDMDDGANGFQDAALSSEAERDDLRRRGALGEHGSTSSDEVDEIAYSGELHHFYPEDHFLGSETVSKWQLKGKRNIRNLTKKSVDRADGKILNIPLGSHYGRKDSTCGIPFYGSDGVDLSRKYFGVGLNNGQYPYARRFLSKGRNDSGYSNMIDWWEDPDHLHPPIRGRWEDNFNLNPIIFGNHHFRGRSRSRLIDVDLKVQVSYHYKKEGVPIISLTSKLNGKAIIGHPIQIEALEDGSSETIVSMNDYRTINAIDHDGKTPLPPAWRTARRTNLRTPRPHLPSENSVFIDQEERFPFKKANTPGGFSHKTGMIRKRVPTKKLPKKASLSSSQKTRTLSSIAGQLPLNYSSGGQIDGLIKPETSRPTTVACIPVKLVFSRLLEKINRPPSKAVMSNRDRDTRRAP